MTEQNKIKRITLVIPRSARSLAADKNKERQPNYQIELMHLNTCIYC